MNDRFRFRIPITNLYGQFDRFIFCDVYHEPIHFIGSAIFLTPEQCTGKKDVKGNLIYEGDIVTWVRPFKDGDVQNVCQIVYDEKHATFGPMLGDFPCQMPQQSELYMDLMGNIHENLELLEDK